MIDARLRDLERVWRSGSDPGAGPRLVLEHLRTGEPIKDPQLALVATYMANRAERQKDTTAYDVLLVRSGFFQLHNTTSRLKRAVVSYFGSMREAMRWAQRAGVAGAVIPRPSSGDYRYLMQSVLSAVQLNALGLVDRPGASVVHTLDDARIGTPFYSGLGYFWNHAYRFTMRSISDVLRKLVHDEFLKAGLRLDGKSRKHEDAIRNVLPFALHGDQGDEDA